MIFERFLIISFSPEGKLYHLLAGARGFLPQYALPPPLIAAIDIAARPELYYQRG